YELFDDAAHAQCGAHLLRHLNDVGQTAAYTAWTTQMTVVLLDAKTASEQAAAVAAGTVEAKVARRLRRRQHHTLDDPFPPLPDGPPPRRRPRVAWSIYQRKAWNLATRKKKDPDQIQPLLDDT